MSFPDFPAFWASIQTCSKIYANYTRLKIDQVDAILFAEQRMINIVIMVEQHC